MIMITYIYFIEILVELTKHQKYFWCFYFNHLRTYFYKFFYTNLYKYSFMNF